MKVLVKGAAELNLVSDIKRDIPKFGRGGGGESKIPTEI